MSPEIPSSDKLVPFCWPSTWTDPALLKLLEGSAINCLLFDGPSDGNPIARAARAAGLTVLEWNALGASSLADVKWGSAAVHTAISGLVWPRIKMSAGRDGAVA